jgi:hypothetical protein
LVAEPVPFIGGLFSTRRVFETKYDVPATDHTTVFGAKQMGKASFSLLVMREFFSLESHGDLC